MYISPTISPLDAQQQVGSSMAASAAVPGAGAAARERLQELLLNSAHRFSQGDTPHLLALLSQMKVWPEASERLPTLVWCHSGGKPQTYGDESRWRLLIAQGPSEHQPELHAALVNEHLQQYGLPAHVPTQDKFRCPPKDALDVVGEMLSVHTDWRSAPGKIPLLDDARSISLRRALADWLQTPDGRRCAIPDSLLGWGPTRSAAGGAEASSSGSAPTRHLLQSKTRELIEPQRSGRRSSTDSDSLPATSPDSTIDVEELETDTSLDGPPSPKVARLAARSTATGVWNGEPISEGARPSLIAPDTVALAAAFRLPEGLVQRSRAMAETLRNGDWNPALDLLVAELMAHFPAFHPLHIDRVEVQGVEGPPWKIGDRVSSNPTRRILRDPKDPGAVYTKECGVGMRHLGPFRGPDAVLTACTNRWVDSSMWPMSRVRSLLAAVIDINPVFVALCLRVADWHPNRDPTVLLRRCRHGSELQPVGRQLLEATTPPRDMSAEEIMAWHRNPVDWAAMQQRLWDDNVCLIHAKSSISPLGATAEAMRFVRRMGFTIKPIRPMEHPERFDAFRNEYPSLLYEEGTEALVRKHVTLRRDPAECVLDLQTCFRAGELASRWRTEGALRLPLHQ